jgi:hypothetical protein
MKNAAFPVGDADGWKPRRTDPGRATIAFHAPVQKPAQPPFAEARRQKNRQLDPG